MYYWTYSRYNSNFHFDPFPHMSHRSPVLNLDILPNLHLQIDTLQSSWFPKNPSECWNRRILNFLIRRNTDIWSISTCELEILWHWASSLSALSASTGSSPDLSYSMQKHKSTMTMNEFMGNAVLATIHIMAMDPVSLTDLKFFLSRKQTNPTF